MNKLYKIYLIYTFISFILISCTIQSQINSRNSPSLNDKIKSNDFLETVKNHLQTQKQKNCNIGNNYKYMPRPAPIQVLDLTGQHQGHTEHFKNAEYYAAFMHYHSSKYFFKNDNEKGSEAINLLLDWSKNKAHDHVKSPREWSSISSTRYPTYMVIGSSLNALFLLDDHPELTVNARKMIWDWLEELIEKSMIKNELPKGTAGFEDKEQRINNHNARRNLILAMYALHKNDNELLIKSNDRIFRSFNSIVNGVPYDANRGNWALNYINIAIQSLVLHTKYYSLVMEDKSYYRKIKIINGSAQFLFRETQNPDEIHQYANQNVGRPQKRYNGLQEIWWNSIIYSGGLVHFAWIDSGILYSVPNDLFWVNDRFEEIGGFVNCWFGD